MIEKSKCPNCGENSFAWEAVPHRSVVEAAIRKDREAKTSSMTSNPSILYCMNCGHIIKIKYPSVVSTPHAHVVVT
ncbi:MAG: hypothetical protein ACFFBD_13965 [Candidatus Hodarchaeota archaeon]